MEGFRSTYLRPVRWTKVFLFSVLATAMIVAAAPPAPAEHDEGLEVKLKLLTSRQIEQGDWVKFRLIADNSTPGSRFLDTTVVVRPKGMPEREVAFKRFRETVLTGDRVIKELSLAPSTWFARTGTYEIGIAGHNEIRPIIVDVTKSSITAPRFEDVTDEAGLSTSLGDFPCGAWTGGAAWGDFDADGDLDLFLPRQAESSHLFINDGTGHFTDEAATRGVASFLGLSATTSDYDNDDDLDLYLTADGPNRLLRNDGKGHFEDVTEQAGVAGDAPSQSSSWGDYDADGYLDLYVTNHARCEPQAQFLDVLYHNNGDGTFDERTGLLHRTGSTKGAGFQTSWFDYDSDGDLDIFLANDYYGPAPEGNVLWRNDGLVGNEWQFTDVSVASGMAVNMNSMGVGIFDYDRDLDFDVAISNIYAPALMQNQGDGTFRNVAAQARIDRTHHDATSIAITWGTVTADFNNDGWEDLYFAAGRLRRGELHQPMDFQPNQMFTNNRRGRFLDHSAPSGTDDPSHTRAAPLADYDGDGRVDIFLVNQDGAPRLLRNVTRGRNRHWVSVDVRGREGNTRACGAVVVAAVGHGARLKQQVMCGGVGLGSSNETALHFGLGRHDRVRKLTVTWLSGRNKVLTDLRSNRRIRVKEPQQ